MRIVEDEELSKISIDQLDLLVTQMKTDELATQELLNAAEKESNVSVKKEKPHTYVRISKDHMRAWIYLEDTGYLYEKSDVLKILSENDIKNGIDDDMVIAIVKKRIYEEEVEIAHGIEAEPDIEGYYEYFWDTELNRKPKILEDGTVDYISMNELPNVKKGQLIARYHPAIPGNPGIGVDGSSVRQVSLKELKRLRGSGYYVGKDQNEYYANLDGKIHFYDGVIEIRPIHIVNGDATLIIGRIEFNGDVEIKGSVSAGVVIKATKNIYIEGTVNAAYLVAGGSILLKKGVSGDYRSKIVARDDIIAEFIEYTEVHAGGNVISNSFLNSYVYANGNVTGKGFRSSIVGGYVHGLKGVQAKNIGNEAQVRTIVHAGYEKDTYDRYHLLSQKETTAQQLIKTVNIRILEIQKKIMFQNIPVYKTEELKRQLIELSNKKEEYEKIYRKILEEKEALGNLIETGRGSRITIYEKAFANSVVSVDKTQWKLENSLASRQFFYQNGVINTKII